MRPDLLRRGVQLLLADAVNPTGVKFNLSTWAEPDREDVINDPAVVRDVHDMPEWVPDAKVPVSCGTQACAMGLFAISGAFAAEGLSYHITQAGHLYPRYTRTSGLGYSDGFEAAAELFGISSHDAQYLFDPDCYHGTVEGEAGEKLVAARIDDFISGVIDKDHHPDHRDEDDGYDD